MEKTAVVIAGAGPAGTVCGLLLRQRGIGCVVVERASFPRDKICGGGLTPRCQELLRRLLPAFSYDYNAVSRIRILLEGKEALVMDTDHEVRIVKRRDFDAQLLEEYRKSGGRFINEALTGIEETGGHIVVKLKGGRQIACDYLVGADGANSRVRKYLNPKAGHDGILCMEQYGPKSPEGAIVFNLSKTYGQGYYYVFPNEACDVQGFGDENTTPQTFRKVLNAMGCPERKALGAYIPRSTDYPLHDRIILIGDAGGFPNRISYEGIYYAFLTAAHAAEAIGTGRPFAEVNRRVFARKRREERIARLIYSGTGLTLLRLFCKCCPGAVKWLYAKATNPSRF